ncbi:hypothetical protein B0A50_06386 [Salinomyces thailandicus]|uniref:Uncharacterized protein n=1 Tax=Salinomyces thailandicus TaxID=706561 RepID=A0A4U0TRS9_9PEZI|nr:hypothetical protein B0A50_06386 [Salinomyces thailandica]
MQSSPPQRAHSRPSSRVDTDYELDLDALGLDDSNTSSPVKPHVDRIASEDIEGPSDFTLNMEKWMRGGGTLGRGLARGGRGERTAVESFHESEINTRTSQDGRGSARGGLRGSPELKGEDERTASHHTPTTSPPRESVWDIRSDDHGEEQAHVSSDWDPYSSATPAPLAPTNNHFLQPTVEEYYSELTPQRLPLPPPQHSHIRNSTTPSTLRPDSCSPARRPSNNSPPVSNSKMSMSSTPGRPSSPTLSPIRSPIIHRSPPTRPPSSYTHPGPAPPSLDTTPQLHVLQAKCQQLSHLNAALQHALSEEQRLRREERSLHEQRMSYYAQREKDVEEMRAGAKERAEELKSELGEVRGRLREVDERSKVEARCLKQEVERIKGEGEEAVTKLRETLERERKGREDAEQTAGTLKVEVEAESRKRRDAEHTTKLLEQDFEAFKAANRTEAQAPAPKSPGSASSDLQVQLQTALADLSALRAAHATSQSLNQTLRADLEQVQLTHETSTLQLTAAHDRAVEQLTVDFEAKAHTLRLQQQDQQEPRLQELQQQTSALRTEHDRTADSLAQTSALLSTTQAQLETSLAVNNALDTRLAGKMRERDAYWRGKIAKLEKEREIMSRGLLKMWGREECGIAFEGEGQRFRYMFPAVKNRGKEVAGSGV